MPKNAAAQKSCGDAGAVKGCNSWCSSAGGAEGAAEPTSPSSTAPSTPYSVALLRSLCDKKTQAKQQRIATHKNTHKHTHNIITDTTEAPTNRKGLTSSHRNHGAIDHVSNRHGRAATEHPGLEDGYKWECKVASGELLFLRQPARKRHEAAMTVSSSTSTCWGTPMGNASWLPRTDAPTHRVSHTHSTHTQGGGLPPPMNSTQPYLLLAHTHVLTYNARIVT